VILQRFQEQPSASTFTIPSIQRILSYWMQGTWVDPYSGRNSPAHITNDINPEVGADFCRDAVDFMMQLESHTYDGILIDPPYSSRQVLEKYRGFRPCHPLTRIYDEACRILVPGGKIISFGWNSNGAGSKRGCVKKAIYLIAHGSQHNDTIVTVEEMVQTRIPLDTPTPQSVEEG